MGRHVARHGSSCASHSSGASGKPLCSSMLIHSSRVGSSVCPCNCSNSSPVPVAATPPSASCGKAWWSTCSRAQRASRLRAYASRGAPLSAFATS